MKKIVYKGFEIMVSEQTKINQEKRYEVIAAGGTVAKKDNMKDAKKYIDKLIEQGEEGKI